MFKNMMVLSAIVFFGYLFMTDSAAIKDFILGSLGLFILLVLSVGFLVSVFNSFSSSGKK